MPRKADSAPRHVHAAEVHAALKDPDHGLIWRDDFDFARAAMMGRLTPRSSEDAVTLAFAAAIDRIYRAREDKLLKETPERRGAAPLLYASIGRDLGMTAAAVASTRKGDRWVGLPEFLAVWQTRTFRTVLEPLLDTYLSQFVQVCYREDSPGIHPSKPSSGDGRAPTALASLNSIRDQTITEREVLELQKQVTEAVGALAAAQQRANARGKALPSTVDWLVVLDAVQTAAVPPGPYRDSDERREGRDPLRAYGITNMSATVRSVFEPRSQLEAREVIAEVQKIAAERQADQGLEVRPVPEGSIRSALWRLHTEPPDPAKRWLDHDGRYYTPGPRMIREQEADEDR